MTNRRKQRGDHDLDTWYSPKSERQWSHQELIKKAIEWLQCSKKCTIVMRELVTRNSETPDCIGFYSSGHGTILIECKTTRADYLADKKKLFRRDTKLGVGSKRYFMVPSGLIAADEVPTRWGLIEVFDSGRKRIAKESGDFTANTHNEITMLVSVIRRLKISTAIFVVPDGVQGSETDVNGK